MKQHRSKVDLGLVYSMYGGVGYPGYYMDAELSKEIFRGMRYYFRKLWRSLKESRSFIKRGALALQNML